jgi:acyl-CoA dehydrogenase
MSTTENRSPGAGGDANPASTGLVGQGRGPAGWDHLFGEEHHALRRSIRDWVTRELRPHVQAWEDAEWVPSSVFRRLGETGFAATPYPVELGGQGGDHLTDAIWTEEIARSGSGGLAAALSAPTTIATPPILKFGTPEQQERWVPPVLRGERVAALAITEPGTGSDVAGIQTRAERVEGGFRVNGEKCFITGGVRAQHYVTAVRTTQDGGHGGISFLVVERGPEPEAAEDDPALLGADRGDGISASPIEKLGWHASDTALVSFQDVFVPEDHLLGELHGGFKLIMANFGWERLSMALGAVAGMDLAFEQTCAYVAQRRAFGRRIADFQGTRWALAEIGMEIEAARSLTYETLRRHVAGEQVIREVSMAKLQTQRTAVDVIDRCLQLHGGAGYTKEQGLERAWRDARLGPIGGGTDEIMKDVIGRLMGC